ncbi:MAG: hypothetical protein JSS72_02945 [Armatimonadetes bacterium]|nr:hypothetical protein [Armatimonadota bacterium]
MFAILPALLLLLIRGPLLNESIARLGFTESFRIAAQKAHVVAIAKQAVRKASAPAPQKLISTETVCESTQVSPWVAKPSCLIGQANPRDGPLS